MYGLKTGSKLFCTCETIFQEILIFECEYAQKIDLRNAAECEEQIFTVQLWTFRDCVNKNVSVRISNGDVTQKGRRNSTQEMLCANQFLLCPSPNSLLVYIYINKMYTYLWLNPHRIYEDKCLSNLNFAQNGGHFWFSS